MASYGSYSRLFERSSLPARFFEWPLNLDIISFVRLNMFILKRWIAVLSICCFPQAIDVIILDASCNGKSPNENMNCPHLRRLTLGRAFPKNPSSFYRSIQTSGCGSCSPRWECQPSCCRHCNIATYLFGDPEKWGEAETRLSNVRNIPATFSTNIRDISNKDELVVFCNMDRYTTTTREDGALWSTYSGI